MTDTIIKGTGNSRSIKAAVSIPTEWEAFRAQLISSGIPVDLTGPNAVGCDVVGTALNKANLLKDTTAALYGKTSTATVDDILKEAREILKSRAIIETGSFIGSGSFFTLYTSAPIQLFFFYGHPTGQYGSYFIMIELPTCYLQIDYSTGGSGGPVVLPQPRSYINGNSRECYGDSGRKYSYWAICKESV